MFVKHFCLYLFLITILVWSPCYGDWESDANARIEQIRKRNAEITVVDSVGAPVPGISMQIEQTKHHFAFGTCIAYWPLYINSDYGNFILDHFEWVVCDHDTKWGANEWYRDVEDYWAADYIYNWCNANGIKMRGHCIFWDIPTEEMPPWVGELPFATYPTPSELLSEVDERIDGAVNHFKGKILNWDVDNEILAGGFFDRLGSQDEGRVHMFQCAKQVDPNCGMFMNEFSGNSFGGYDPSLYVSRAASLISKGAPIDGFGIQAHLLANALFEPQRYYDDVLEPLAVFGKPIWATEFDAPHYNETISADNIENFFRICFSHPNVEGIMMWGFLKDAMWSGNAHLVDSNWVLTERGERYEALMNEWTTIDANATNLDGKVSFRGFHGTYQITLFAPGQGPEAHTIELEPGGTTALFELETELEEPEEDTAAPVPDPLVWATVPTTTWTDTITMTATTATDATLPIKYYFECTTDGSKSSAWQSSTTYLAANLTPGTLYSFRVKARDSAPLRNETGWSSTQSATTWPLDTTPPTPNPMTWATAPAAIGQTSITMTASTATDANNPPVQYFFECATDGSKSSGWQASTTYEAKYLDPATLYSFRVKARDSAPALNETDWSSTESVTTLPPTTDVTVLGSWVSGFYHTREPGCKRALIFIAYGESASSMNLSDVSYGVEQMTKVIDRNYSAAGGYVYVAAYILKEAGITAAINSKLNPYWSTGVPPAYGYSSVFLSNVDQANSVTVSASGGSTTNPVTTSALATSDGYMVILGATCGNLGSYTLNNGFTEGTDGVFGTDGLTGVTGHKSATGANETPSATYSSTVNQQTIIGFVIKAAPGPVAPTGLSATADNHTVSLDWNDNEETGLAGYNVYRSITSGIGYGKINTSLVIDSNYIDNDVNNGTPYFYIVTAVDTNSDESAYSNEDSATPNYQDCDQVRTGGYGLESDLTGDCYVNYKDLKIIADYWLNTDCSGQDNCEGADFGPTDGDVDFFDFGDFAVQWMLCNDPEDPDCTPNW